MYYYSSMLLNRCNLAAKESGLEHAFVNKDDFSVLISGGGRHPWVNRCTVWLSHSEGVEQYVCIKLEHSSVETILMVQKATALGNWWLAASSQQCTLSHITSRVEFFGKTSNHPGDSATRYLRFGVLWLLVFPKTKITFEKSEVSDCHWDSAKYDGTADGDWENCVRSQGDYFEGD